MLPRASLTGLSPFIAGLSSSVLLRLKVTSAVRTPERSRSGLGSFLFARRYLGNRFFFLFLRLLRCFSSPGSPPYTMDSCMDTWSLSMWVSPFRDPRLSGYLLLPAAFRSLSRLSSALSAKASSLRPFLLDHLSVCRSFLSGSSSSVRIALRTWSPGSFLGSCLLLLVFFLPPSYDDGLGCLILYMGSLTLYSIQCLSSHI